MEKRAAGDASLEALQGTAERLYTQIVLAANNERIPPPWTPFRFLRYLRWAWLVEGGAQHFSRQVDFYRAAVIRRLREGSRPVFPAVTPRRDPARRHRSSTCSRTTAAVAPANCSSQAPPRRPRSQPRGGLRPADAGHRRHVAPVPAGHLPARSGRARRPDQPRPDPLALLQLRQGDPVGRSEAHPGRILQRSSSFSGTLTFLAESGHPQLEPS